MLPIWQRLLRWLRAVPFHNLTLNRASPISSKSREVSTSRIHEERREVTPLVCPACAADSYFKRGKRVNKYQTVQLYQCKDCHRTFTAQTVKGRRFPLTAILEAITLYNRGYTLKQVSYLLQQKFSVQPKPATISTWLAKYENLCRYSRLRPFIMKKFNIANLIEVTTMAHQQIYCFRYHRGKIDTLLRELNHYRLRPLRDFLDTVSTDTPHQYFSGGIRISDVRTPFDKTQLIIKGKHNYANQLAALVLPTVRNNKQRHEAVQRFMLANDSVTVATEVPVYITQASIEHLQNQLNFKVLTDNGIKLKGKRNKYRGRLLLTGHIDIIQVRNGIVHLLDYKPQAARAKPVEQLTWYALALSRLTGLRLFDFKCAWFDEKEYFEFYPLHVVHKLQSKRRRKTVRYRSGQRAAIPQENTLTVVR